MKIAVVGTGYVGLVTGTCFSETGNHVTCVDINEAKINQMKAGVVPIYEPGLEDLFHRNVEEGRLNFTTSLVEGIEGAKVIFLALPTPPGEDGSADLKYILQVANDLGPLLKEYTVIIDKSTVPVGTSELVKNAIAKNAKVPFDVVSNPEFLREGVAVEDFMKPDRVVIGTESDRAKELMTKLYAPLVRQGNPIIFMDERSAEMTKYAANAFLATKITFMNEIANLCELVGANVDDIRRGIGTDSRIGKRFLFAGIGYGGSCFPKDVQALAKTSEENNYKFHILDSVMRVNENQKTKLLPQVRQYFNHDLAGKTIAIWGLAFKPYTDDIREAPALYNIEALLEAGCTIKAYDPEAMPNVQALLGDSVQFCKNPYEALEEADALLIVTEWPQFRTPDFEKMDSLLKNKVIFDGRNLYELSQMKELGYTYYSIGRQTILS
ncbi:UDP-glucose/GDP-mannose dehydrogenase family protein [Aquirufa nivalisilvae]|jgi:UDPglucose 6-dehydrogenase|uniref:UDP-glucose 6-dehydrogenase n=1 Tax=Aquirufa nivalisilvae TaxID=2516557 RepID=A0A2S2DX05_9BACT|nr:UDP-glucose/GDP-mannose dehydrogenase family protein [Aquirufa nivalisilvae]AWL09560.1 UDP-glucose 6-dehydrogenase [Aquirufa nivalisilvae]MCZ2480915.1 UDP-glucose/GDP-mannose dehydrogenase family protein [Aquirufa nivalisilvae]MCZ2483776.1 UDP-glucose/GDP-mannose dehydrogenase family protein [Aquirufa nivalisilvae]